jgi:hypothetical protein
MCGFKADGQFLVGWNGKLWCLQSKDSNPKRRGYRNNWPWTHAPGRLSIDFCWAPLRNWDDDMTDFGSYEPEEYVGRYVVYEKRGKRNFKDVHSGPLENVSHLLIRLQRWCKRMVRRQRTLALCMGMHARLGAKCLIGDLGEDLLAMIVKIK